MIRSLSMLGAVAMLAVCACAPAAPPQARSGAAQPAQYFGSTKPAGDVLRFNNGAEPEYIDPAVATGQPDGRICRILFSGLVEEDPHTLEPRPACAYRWDISADGLTYTFHLRPGLVWSDGRPLLAEDFRWSWVRVLEPKTAARNAGLLSPIENAQPFNKGELKDGTQVGITAPDDSTLIVLLKAPTAYFLSLTSFYAFMPCPRHIIEKYGDQWTRPGHLIGNGPFLLDFWKQSDRFEMTRNPRFWDAASVKLDRIIAYTVEDLNTSTNLYKAGVIDWNPSGYIPSPFLPYLKTFADFSTGPYQNLYFYSINTTRKPFDNVWVRRALTYAIDRDAIANDLLKGTQLPWGNFTPQGYPGYQAPTPVRYDPDYARECLAKAGYPNGVGLRKFQILFNTSENHRRIAEAIQQMWRRELHIQVELSNQEWASYLKATTGLDYDVARRSWIGDYLDPNSFLGSYITGDGNNRTGWSSPRYDALIRDAAMEPDATRRLAMLAEAEALLLNDSPVMPIYHYMSTELVKPYVRGLYPTPLDVHPLTRVSIDRAWRNAPAARADASAPGTPTR